MPVVSIAFTLGSTTASAVQPANLPTAYGRRTTSLPRPFLFCFASRSDVNPFHWVDAHFAIVPPPLGQHTSVLPSSSHIGFCNFLVKLIPFQFAAAPPYQGKSDIKPLLLRHLTQFPLTRCPILMPVAAKPTA